MIICKLVCMQEMKWNEMKGLLQFFQFVHPLELKIWSLLLMLHIEFFTCCCIGASLRHCLHFCSLAYELTIKRHRGMYKLGSRVGSSFYFEQFLWFLAFSVSTKTLMNSYILWFEFLGENFSETIRYIGLTFSEITEIVMTFQNSVILFQKLDQGMKRICQ